MFSCLFLLIKNDRHLLNGCGSKSPRARPLCLARPGLAQIQGERERERIMVLKGEHCMNRGWGGGLPISKILSLTGEVRALTFLGGGEKLAPSLSSPPEQRIQTGMRKQPADAHVPPGMPKARRRTRHAAPGIGGGHVRGGGPKSGTYA